MKTSNLFSLNIQDLLHGLYSAVAGAVAAPLITYSEQLSTGHVLTFPDYKTIGGYALGAAVAYIIKSFVTPAQIITPASK